MNFLKRLFSFSTDTADILIHDNVSVFAAQASFWIIISTIPFIMLLLTLIKFVTPVDETQVITLVRQYVPSEINEFLLTLVNELFNRSSSIPIISVTAVSTLWLASKGISALLIGLNKIYENPKPLNYFFRCFMAVLYTFILVVALIATFTVFALGNKIEELISGKFVFFAEILHFILNSRIIIFPVILTLIVASFYKFLPQVNNSFRRQLPGAAGVAVGWMIFSYFYSIYIKYSSNYPYVYGSLTAIVLLMLWLYFCMNIFLFGGEFNKLLEAKHFGKYFGKNKKI